MKHIILIAVGSLLLSIHPFTRIHAASKIEYVQGIVVQAPSEKQVVVRTGLEQNPKHYTIETFAQNYNSKSVYKVGDRLVVALNAIDGKIIPTIAERDRTIPYVALGFVFLLVVLLIGRFRGLAAIIAMMASFLLLVNLTVPQIIAGVDPVVVSVLSGLVIVPLTFYLTHGFNQRTSLAVAATMIALVVTGLLSTLFTYVTSLSGYSSEEATGLMLRFGESFGFHNLLIAGMIISSMGILDDVTISQVGIVYSLSKAKPNMKVNQLFVEAMKLGRDHIGSLVNTLILVYVGAALPMLLLVYKTDVPLWVVIQKESIAEEIVRTLVSSIGIILSVPIATMLGIRWGRKHVGFLQREKLF